ncbi:ubiquinol-cytochrome C chaperone family protein [Glycocaulis sp.]|uniref:ubiquinol-cytochrome C chaperone family protein n=1 Tax=Glycocaulis sp. TaxID=1969725 RepID=UPI003F70FA3D
MRFPLNLFRADPVKARASQLYEAILAEARAPRLYAELGVPDTVDGRFDMIVLHAALVMRRLREEGEGGQKLAQALFGRLFDDMDAALREMGIGDMSVGKKIKTMAEAFYGRAAAYDGALKAGDAGQLKAVLWRNLFDDAPEHEGAAEALSRHAIAADQQIRSMPADQLLEGRLGALAVA